MSRSRGALANSRGRRLLWFAGLWLAGVLAVAIVAFVLRGLFSLA